VEEQPQKIVQIHCLWLHIVKVLKDKQAKMITQKMHQQLKIGVSAEQLLILWFS